MAEKQFNITLKAIDKFSGPMKKATAGAKSMSDAFKRANAELRKSNSGFASFANSLKKIGDGMVDVGKKMTKFVTLPVIAGMTYSVKKFADFEDAVTALADTTGKSGAELDDLTQRLRDLAKTTPTPVEALMGLAEVASKAGAKTVDEIMAVVDTMNKLKETSKLGDETAETFSRILHAAGEPLENIKKLGAAMASLGDSVDDQKIVDATDKIAQSIAGLYKIGSEDMIALGTVFAKMNLPVKKVGTIVKSTFDSINKSFTGKKGGSSSVLSQLTGIKSKDLKKAFATDKFAVFQKLVAGLAAKTKKGLDIKDDIKKLGLDEGIAGLVDRYDDLQVAIDETNKQFETEAALNEDSKAKWKSLNSQMAIIKNQFNDIALSIGTKLAPYVRDRLIPAIKNLIAWFEKNPKIAEFTGKVILLTAALGPLLIVVGYVVSSIGSMLKGMLLARIAVQLFGGTIAASTAALGAWAVAIAGVGALAYVIVSNWETAKEFFTKLWNGPIGAIFKFTNPLYLLYRLGGLIMSAWSPVSNFFTTLWNGPIGSIIRFTNPLYYLYELAAMIPIPWQKVGDFFSNLWDGIKNKFMEMYNYIASHAAELADILMFGQGEHFFTPGASAVDKATTPYGRKKMEEWKKNHPNQNPADAGNTSSKGSGVPVVQTASANVNPKMGAPVTTTKLVTQEKTITKVNNAKVVVDFKNIPKGTTVSSTPKTAALNVNLGYATA